MKLLVTGVAGFIGMNVAERFLEEGFDVFGIDNINDYYDPQLKVARLDNISRFPNFTFNKIDITNAQDLTAFALDNKIDHIIHLAGQAGVRYSMQNPSAYSKANLEGFLNILEVARIGHAKHLVYASSSSVYGGNTKLPFSESDEVNHPVSLYAATKKANELMAHAYSHAYKIPTTGLRLFTVYGPWGRPDMSPTLFAKAIYEGRPLVIFNHGVMKRDFTYIGDVVDKIFKLINYYPTNSSIPKLKSTPFASAIAPWRIFNIGNSGTIPLIDYVHIFERLLDKKAIIDFQDLQTGDVLETLADVSLIEDALGGSVHTSVEDGLESFIKWFLMYYYE
jgi:UDP-glucuronate 4-epimerase